MKKFVITESDKKHIESLYNINESESSDKKDINQDIISLTTDEPNDKPKDKSFIEVLLNKLTNKTVINKEKKEKETNNTQSNDDYLNNKSSGSVDSKWLKVTKKVIDKLEGGYWNGSTSKNDKTSKLGICSNHPQGSMGASTETMFGLDRYNGSIEKTADGKEFFRIIDSQKKELGMDKFCRKWKWLYRGGDLEDRLKTLAAKIMKHSYDRNANNYFTPELKKRVENNDRLLMHFSYASWNGPWFFQQFANSLNKAVKEGKSDKELLKQAISDRHNTRLIRQQKVAAVLTDPDLNLA